MAPDRAVAMCRALADPTRLALMAAIWESERCVCDLRDACGAPAPNLASHHLAALRRAGLVEPRREGRWIYYHPAADLDEPTAALLTLLLGPRGSGTARCA